MREILFRGKVRGNYNGYHSVIKDKGWIYGGLIRVNVNNMLSREYPFCNETFEFYGGVGSSLVHIQDLIDKGLVEEL